VPSLQARSPLRSAHPLLLLINKAVSHGAFVLLLFAGWLALNYVRTEWQNNWRASSEAPAVSVSSPALQETSAVQTTSTKPQRLVYTCASDDGHYHALTHLQHCKRTGLSEEAALARGLKRCTICLPE